VRPKNDEAPACQAICPSGHERATRAVEVDERVVADLARRIEQASEGVGEGRDAVVEQHPGAFMGRREIAVGRKAGDFGEGHRGLKG